MRNNEDVMYEARCRLCGRIIHVHIDETFPICSDCESTKEKLPNRKKGRNLRGENVSRYRERYRDSEDN